MFLRDPLCEVPRLTETCLVRLVIILTLLILGMVYRMPENKTHWRMFHAMFYYDSNNSNSSKGTLFLNKHVLQTRLAYLGWGLLPDTLGSFSKPRQWWQWERHQTKGLISSENNSSVCGFWDFVRFFAVLCKTTMWRYFGECVPQWLIFVPSFWIEHCHYIFSLSKFNKVSFSASKTPYWVGMCGLGLHKNLTPFKTNICDFPSLFMIWPIIRYSLRPVSDLTYN